MDRWQDARTRTCYEITAQGNTAPVLSFCGKWFAETNSTANLGRIAANRKDIIMAETWLPSLKTATPQEGFELATKLARVGVKLTQPSAEIRDKLRAAYEQDSTQLIASSQVIAIHFQTVAAANNYWRE
jgi:hypothetical protein